MTRQTKDLLPEQTEVCPFCGNDDLQLWADDGEADLADWWECGRCMASGAILDPDDRTKTQNGVAV